MNPARATNWVAMLLIAAASVAAHAATARYEPPTLEAFLRTIRAYPYQTDAPRAARIRAGVTRLAPGYTVEQVREALGDPDFAEVAFSENSNGTVPETVLWNYIIEKREAPELKPGTRAVVWLSPDGKVRAITVHGMPGIEPGSSR